MAKPTNITLLLAMFMVSCKQYHQAIPRNEHGLPIVKDKRDYRHTLLNNEGKRMVALSNYISPLVTDWKYATDSNFTRQVLYQNPGAYMRLEAALALQKINEELKQKGLGLKVFDAYRPYSVTKKMWEVVPDENYAANPAKGSGHNRGAAIDLTLYELATGKELAMPTPFDDFTVKAHHDYMQLDSAVLVNRQTLKDIMVKHGFVPLPTEWWHYYLPKAADRFELMDINFREMSKLAKP